MTRPTAPRRDDGGPASTRAVVGARPFVWHKSADQILDSLKEHLANL